MSLNIKTATGLLEIGGSVTKEKVISALGYEPADKEVETTVDTHVKDTDIHIASDERTLWNKDVENLDAHKSDKTVHVTSTEKQTWNNKSDFSGAYADLIDAPSITETETGNVVIADESGNIIMQVDADGVTTTNVNTKTIELNGKDLGSRLDEIEAASLTNIVDNETGDLTIADESGNVIVKIDASGLETTQVTAKSVVINGTDIKAKVDEHIDDDVSHITETERATWNAKASTDYVDGKVAGLVNSAPEALNTLDELAAALGDDENFAVTITNQIASKVSQTEFDSHTHTKAQIGLGNVDNTSDANKPVSTAQREALNALKSELSESIVSESEEWTIVDNSGNIVAKVDAGGLETTTVTADAVVVNGTNVEVALAGKAASEHIHDQYLEASDIESKADTTYVDEKIDEAKADAANKDAVVLMEAQKNINTIQNTVDTHIDRTDIHITADERTLWNNKSDFDGSYNSLTDAPNIIEDNTGDLIIADNNGNIIFRSNSNGFETTTLTAQTIILNGTDVETRLNELESYVAVTTAQIDTLFT